MVFFFLIVYIFLPSQFDCVVSVVLRHDIMPCLDRDFTADAIPESEEV